MAERYGRGPAADGRGRQGRTHSRRQEGREESCSRREEEAGRDPALDERKRPGEILLSTRGRG
ncbi:MAG TPA: hypothetical protein VKZ83_13100, partial [Phototrophicaceae bacterium]|nr:hypothetical protein [Phototrophicaceae bacterium]